MELEIKNENGTLKIKIIGKIDTMTAPILEEEISKNFDGINEVIFNFEQVKYMSSSGIRVLVGTSKKVNNNMKIIKPTDEVMEVFTITGLATKFNIER
ncbi:MAG: STAS domain-containing protein [Clostridia bacterium]|nr:STAS domain-containing protein [Clostridia bacterium]